MGGAGDSSGSMNLRPAGGAGVPGHGGARVARRLRRAAAASGAAAERPRERGRFGGGLMVGRDRRAPTRRRLT